MRCFVSMLCCLALFSGCYHKPEESDLSGVKGSRVALLLLDAQGFDQNKNLASIIRLIERVSFEEGLEVPEEIQALTSHKSFVAFTGAAFVPVVSAAVQLGFDLYLDQQARELKEIKKAAQRTYSAKLFANLDQFRDSKYLALVRYIENEGKMEPGFILVCEFVEQGISNKSFTIKPVHVTAFNSVALTAKSDAKMNYTVALSLKAAHINKQKLYTIVEVGQGVTSFKGLRIPSDILRNYCDEGLCAESDLIAAPVDLLDRLSVTLSVTETGNMKIDFDKREAELKAIKEAVGPVLKDFTGEILKDDE